MGEREGTETFPGLPQTSKMEIFATMANSEQPLTFVSKRSILDVCGWPGHVSGSYWVEIDRWFPVSEAVI